MKFTKLMNAFEKKATEKGLKVKDVPSEYLHQIKDILAAQNIFIEGK